MSLILIVEDSRTMAEAAGEALKKAGHETAWCLTVGEAVSLCQERKPDLVVSEFYVQDGSCLDLLEKLARGNPRPPLAVVTGYGREEAAVRALELGALAWESKTESYLKRLPELVERIFQIRREREAEAEKSLARRRQEAQNELAGWLAHNFKNILAGSIGYLNLIDFNNPGQDRGKQRQYLEESRQSQQSAIDLLEQLIRLTDGEEGETERIIVAEVVDEAWEAARARVLESRSQADPEGAESLAAKMKSVVFINSARRLEPVNMVLADLASVAEALLQNALEAVLNGRDPRILVLAEKNDGTLELTVKDNGRGMSPDVLKHAAEPFFSTKGEVGVGLSLSLVNSLVLRHGGNLNLKSSPGVGTTVKASFRL